ncbi:MAG: hypothetical protein Q9220_005364 [cf. Caloplaca sp. 1 TL-2023]
MFVEVPVSGIHRLFSAATSQSSTPHSRPPVPESVTEEAHTYDLLYPDFDALHQPQDQAYPLHHGLSRTIASAASSFDDRGGLDFQFPRDIRIIIAQDGNLSQQAKVLFDSQPPPQFPSSRLSSPTDPNGGRDDNRSQATGLFHRAQTSLESPSRVGHGRFFSLNQTSPTSSLEKTSPVSPAPDLRRSFGGSRARRSTARPATSDGENHQTRLAREGKEEVEALLGCMFGSTGLPLVSGTKFHVQPIPSLDSQSVSANDASAISPDPGLSRPSTRRRTPLTRSTTADDIRDMSTVASADRVYSDASQSKRASILITRLFTVDPPHALSPRLDHDSRQPPSHDPDVQHHDFQFPRPSSTLSSTSGARQIRCPTYAISLMLRLPPSLHHQSSTTSQMTSPLKTNPCDHLITSVTPRASAESAMEDANSRTDYDIEQIVSHWGLLMRLLSSLECVVQKRILKLLENLDLRFPFSLPQRPSAVDSKSTQERPLSPVKRSKQIFQRTIQLPPDALQNLEDIRRESYNFGKRVAVVLRTQRVVTGQGRWGVWREEARWVGKWAGSREQNFFFFNLLSVFLGSHTEWLDSFGNTGLHRSGLRSETRSAEPQRRQQTIVVTPSKMAARRLIFLLAAFLPRTASLGLDGTSVLKSAWTGISLSQSPPSGIPILREQSLRRTINRRQRGNLPSQGHRSTHTRSSDVVSPEPEHTADATFSNRSNSGHHTRRTSDTKSLRSPALPMATSGESTRKSSTTTTSTVVPDTALPVAHFSNASREPLLGTSPVARPGSSGSLASLSLKHTLYRSESNEHSNASTSSQSFSRWGSLMSGFWSSRRGSSTDESETMSPTEGLGISGLPKLPAPTSSIGTLARMVEEAESVSQSDGRTKNVGHCSTSPHNPEEASRNEAATGQEMHGAKARNIPERPRVESFPIKLSVDDNDGIIDVELPPLDSRSSSCGSSASFTGPCQTAASSFNERSSIFTRSPSKERSRPPPSQPIDVAGWLKEYSPDFVLQAVKPYKELHDDVKEALRAEPIPQSSSSHDTPEEWSNIRTALIADATTFSITRFCYQRRSKPQTSGSAAEPADQTIEERVLEEPMMDMDPTLIDVVERVLAQSGPSTAVHSRAPSPSRGGATANPSQSLVQQKTERSQLEVPKSECKKLVLGALEDIVKSVMAEEDAGGGGGGSRAKSIAGGEPVRVGDANEHLMPDSTLRDGVRRWLKGVA